MKNLMLRGLARVYLPIYDLAMRLGPKWGPIALGYGPVVLGIAAFLLKAQTLDRWMDPDRATVAIFVAFALTGPVMHVGTRIVTERIHRSRQGQWPVSADGRFDRNGPVSPTEHWVEMIRAWSREAA